jgi:ketosteroid isomerase-like protein
VSVPPDLIRLLFAVFNERDWDRIPDVFDPEVEWHPAAEDPDPNPRFGHAGVRRFGEMWLEVLPDIRLEPEEVREAGDKLLVLNHYRAHGAGSGAEVEDRVFQVLTLRAGRILRVDEFYEREDAERCLEAA